MDTQQDPLANRSDRIPVDITVTIIGVLTSGEVRIRNLTEHGALIQGMYLSKGSQFQIEFEGQTLFGSVAWSEADRFGVSFPFPLHDGPLYRELELARMRHEMQHHGIGGGTFATAAHRSPAQFGRRGLN